MNPTAASGKTSTDPLARLNPAQREAATHFEGPILVLAGAGSGKTRVLTTRIARLIEEHGVDPRHILAVTFTNKAAGEMRERVARLLGEQPAGMWAGTFHAIGARILRHEARHAGRSASFTIYDEEDSIAAIKRAMERLNISTKQYSPKAIRAAISDAKNALVSVKEYTSLAMDPLSRAAAQVYAELERVLREGNAADFDDLLVLPVRIFQENPDRLAVYRERFKFILVDEYQDTNRAQYQLIKLLGGEHGNVLVVGDDDQSIYGWRGADIRNILDFEKDFPEAKVVRLEENYRSTPQVLDLANVVISANKSRRGKTLRATREAGEKVVAVACADERDEGDFVAEEILDRRRLPGGAALRDFAILYRTNSQSRAMEEALRKRGIPYRIVGAVRFYDRREIRDLMAYLKLIANPADDEAFRRSVGVPRRGLGDTTIDRLAEGARDAGVPLLAAASRSDLLEPLRPAARNALISFATLIRRSRERVAARPRGGGPLRRISQARRAGQCRPHRERARAHHERRGDCAGRGRGAGPHPARQLPAAHLARHGARQARPRRRRRDDDDAAQRQGTRVSRGVHQRPGGGPLSAQPFARRPRVARRGAATLLRRDHARRAEALPLARAQPAAQRRGDALHAVELPPADPRRDARAARHAATARLRVHELDRLRVAFGAHDGFWQHGGVETLWNPGPAFAGVGPGHRCLAGRACFRSR